MARRRERRRVKTHNTWMTVLVCSTSRALCIIHRGISPCSTRVERTPYNTHITTKNANDTLWPSQNTSETRNGKNSNTNPSFFKQIHPCTHKITQSLQRRPPSNSDFKAYLYTYTGAHTRTNIAHIIIIHIATHARMRTHDNKHTQQHTRTNTRLHNSKHTNTRTQTHAHKKNTQTHTNTHQHIHQETQTRTHTHSTTNQKRYVRLTKYFVSLSHASVGHPFSKFSLRSQH